MRRLLLVATAQDVRRATALCNEIPDAEVHVTSPVAAPERREERWNAVVVTLPPDDPAMGAALAAYSYSVPIVALVDVFDRDVAAVVARVGARVCTYALGASVLTETIARVAELTERRLSLVASERIHRIVASSVADVVFVLGVEPDGFRFLEVNPGFIRATGLTEDAVVGQRVEAVIPEPSLSLVLGRYQAAIATRDVVRWTEVTPYPTGTKHGDVSVTPVFEGERCTHLIGTVHDVTALRQAEAQLRALSTHVEAVREEERTGIAREIHDQLGQSLTALVMDVSWIATRARAPAGIAMDVLLARLDEMREICRTMIDQTRRISSELRPAVLDDLGLNAAVVWQGTEFERRTGIPCVVRAAASDADLGRDVTTAVFRVLQEALTNIARHAGARRVEVELDRQHQELSLSVRDDGRGIRPEESEGLTSLGILGMRERARRVGGTASFTVAQPGTRMVMRVPLGAQR
jgi:PAS domain S-box-containing protein